MLSEQISRGFSYSVEYHLINTISSFPNHSKTDVKHEEALYSGLSCIVLHNPR